MSTITEQGNKESLTQIDTLCHVCNTTKEDFLLSCANFYCSHKAHASCAVRPEGTRLHFCSVECVMQYFEK
jgi:hypothetical protein